MQLISDMGTRLHGVVIMGDFMDMFTLGSYNANSLGLLTGIDLGMEYEDANEGLDNIEQASHKALKKVYLFGNHEYRYFTEVNKADNAKYGSALKNPVEALGLDHRGYEFFTRWKHDFYILGTDLAVTHGFRHPIHAAKAHLDIVDHSAVFCHTHRIQSFHIGERAAYNIGFMGNLKDSAFGYADIGAHRTWANGFARVHVNDNGGYWLEQIKPHNDSFVCDGRMY